MVHIPTRTAIYIDAAGTKETRTITRADLADIHTALTTFVPHDWVGMFADSLSSLQAIRHKNINPCSSSSLHYRHHMLLLESISDLLETRKLAGFRTILHKSSAHANIRGNELVDEATKLTVADFYTLPPT